MQLNNFGFIEVGEWKLEEGLKSGVTFILYKLQRQRVIYAFVVNDEGKSIDVCSNKNTILKIE
jgi:hypothetical protein